MQDNRGKDTKPEIAIRRLVHHMGYRYRLHRTDLPGSPDLTFGARKKVIFVHGCFWHAHGCAVGGQGVQTRASYWAAKFARNRKRDGRVLAELAALGWSTLVIWECELRNKMVLETRINAFLSS